MSRNSIDRYNRMIAAGSGVGGGNCGLLPKMVFAAYVSLTVALMVRRWLGC